MIQNGFQTKKLKTPNGTLDPPGKSHEKFPLPLKASHLHPLAIAADLVQLGTRGDQPDHGEGRHHRLFSPCATCQVKF